MRVTAGPGGVFGCSTCACIPVFVPHGGVHAAHADAELGRHHVGE